jgi:hypothetical protein
MNLSTPKNRSLNDDLKAEKIPKIFMTTAKDFSNAVYKAGYNAKMSKMDIVSAYKIVPSCARTVGSALISPLPLGT